VKIDYRKLADAVEYYTGIGYAYLDVSWLVSAEANGATAPPQARRFETHMGELVGSGEQSLIDLWIEGHLTEPGKYVCCTPCFRDEQYDRHHLPYFMKVELMNYAPLFPASAANDLCREAVAFFGKYAEPHIVKTEIGEDIQIAGLEVGSYGWREFEHGGRKMVWAYGTGVAEPRLSQAIDLLKRRV
jgi:hypothetical protein